MNVAVGIITENNAFLISKRSIHQSHPNCWEFVGGKIEHQETPLDALKREVFEEVGLEVVGAKFWFDLSYEYYDRTINLSIFDVQQYVGTAYAKEQQQILWVPKPQLTEYPFLEANQIILKKIHHEFRV